MSSNNELVIIKEKGKYIVHINSCVDNDFIPSKDTLLKKVDTLVEAIKYAKEYCNDWPYVGYNYYIDDSCLEDKK